MAAVEMAVLPFSTLGWEQLIVCRDANGRHGQHTGNTLADSCPVASHPPSPPKYAPSSSGEAEESPKVLWVMDELSREQGLLWEWGPTFW